MSLSHSLKQRTRSFQSHAKDHAQRKRKRVDKSDQPAAGDGGDGASGSSSSAGSGTGGFIPRMPSRKDQVRSSQDGYLSTLAAKIRHEFQHSEVGCKGKRKKWRQEHQKPSSQVDENVQEGDDTQAAATENQSAANSVENQPPSTESATKKIKTNHVRSNAPVNVFAALNDEDENEVNHDEEQEDSQPQVTKKDETSSSSSSSSTVSNDTQEKKEATQNVDDKKKADEAENEEDGEDGEEDDEDDEEDKEATKDGVKAASGAPSSTKKKPTKKKKNTNKKKSNKKKRK